jgi:hypothetical protein
MKRLVKIRRADGKINPYPFLILVAVVMIILFTVFRFIFRNQVY